MIVLATDFGLAGPYTGQVKAVLARAAPEVPVVDLFADLPSREPRPAAYLLAAYGAAFDPGDVICAVVDPGVGGARRPLALQADGRWWVGPDNGLFELVLRRATTTISLAITWRPDQLSATFHGRDLFAPVAARLARGQIPPGPPTDPRRFPDWPDDLAEIVYLDHYGNALTGLRAATLPGATKLRVGTTTIARARTFGDVADGAPLWYENANGLAEIAINGGSAARSLGLELGATVSVLPTPR